MSYRRRILRTKRARRSAVEKWLRDAERLIWAAMPLMRSTLTPPDRPWFTLKVKR